MYVVLKALELSIVIGYFVRVNVSLTIGVIAIKNHVNKQNKLSCFDNEKIISDKSNIFERNLLPTFTICHSKVLCLSLQGSTRLS